MNGPHPPDASMMAETPPWDGFRRFPPVALDDPRLKSHHVDLLLALSVFTDAKKIDDEYQVVVRGPLTSAVLSNFTSVSAKHIGQYLVALQRFRYVVLARDGNHITDVRWNLRTAGVSSAIKGNYGWPWVRVPKPVLHDATLTAGQRHAYACLCWLQFDLARRAGRKAKHSFHVTTTLLAKTMHYSQPTAKRRLRELEDLGLIEHFDGRTLKGARPMRFVPLGVRYAAYEHAAGTVPLGRPRFRVHPELAASLEAWRSREHVTRLVLDYRGEIDGEGADAGP
jgi:hypothetical protein